MLTRWQPFGEVRSDLNWLHDEMNRLFDSRSGGSRSFAQNVYPPLNLWEDESAYYIETELAGFELDDLEMYVNGENQLSIKGERKQPKLEKGTWHRQERGYGSFNRQMELPGPVASDKVSAEFKNGVLTIALPKKEEAKPRRIEVKVR